MEEKVYILYYEVEDDEDFISKRVGIFNDETMLKRVVNTHLNNLINLIDTTQYEYDVEQERFLISLLVKPKDGCWNRCDHRFIIKERILNVIDTEFIQLQWYL